ncbi:MAG: UDP-N-acetylmuramate dehydrogenase [Spirochaetota bacterium]
MTGAAFQELERHLPFIRKNASLARLNSFRIRTRAEYLIAPRTEADVIDALRAAREHGLTVHVLGGGTNVLLSDGLIHGMVIWLGGMRRWRLEGTMLFAEGGMAISRASVLCARRSLAGMSFAYGLPGSVGGAVYMNAKCYGSEIAVILVSVRYIDSDLSIKTIARADMELAYKSTPFQHGGRIILEAAFRLTPGDKRGIRAEMKKNFADRKAKQHFRFPSAGSIFLNDYSIGIPSGKMIDEAGLLGMREGGAQVAPYHGNFIINRKNATARDVAVLIQRVQALVKEKRGIELKPEVRFMGDWDIDAGGM